MTDRLRLPDGFERRVLVGGVLVWGGALLGLRWGWMAMAALMLAAAPAALARRHIVAVRIALALGVAVAGCVSGTLASARDAATAGAEVPVGPVTLEGRLAEDPVALFDTTRMLVAPRSLRSNGVWVPWSGPAMIVEISDSRGAQAGDLIRAAGTARSAPVRLRGDPAAAVVRAHELEVIDRASGPFFALANILRRRVAAALDPHRPRSEAALLSGFVIGDTSGLARRDADALRRSGLSHYVAVSGSNVALFLAAWWFVTAPVAFDVRVRSLIGLFGLVTFVLATRWEPSVVRAAVMAAVVLIGRLGGVPVSGWTALGTASAVLLLVSGDLAASVGFQLSVAATAGVLAGAAIFADRHPRPPWMLLGATLSAQIAVMPLLLFHFGEIPLMAPIANLLAAPLVTIATSLGGAGIVAGSDMLVRAGLVATRGVMAIADVASAWPQLGVAGAGVALVATAAAGRRASLRPVFGLSLAAVVLLVVTVSPDDVGIRPSMTVLDVGQGDAVLLRGSAGGTVLVDGGRDPVILRRALDRHGVRWIDVLVVTHGDADHAGALAELAGDLPVGRVWRSPQPEQGALVDTLVGTALARSIPVETVAAGDGFRIGTLQIQIIGPGRRYESDNDGSIVMLVEAGGPTVLLGGDIEAVAQRELPPIHPDVILVPHHGAATTDIGWLDRLDAGLALISVGVNSYGHPAEEVVATLRDAGATIYTTLDHGDITIPIGP